jgi:uncharacterized membrane protein
VAPSLEGGTSVSAYGLFLLLILGLLIVAAIFLFLPGRRSQDRERSPADRPPPAVYRDDERYWLGGVIYYNRDDPELFIPKRYGWGWTVNFAHPGGKLFLAFMALLVLLPVLLLLLGVQLPPVGCHPSGCSPAR